MFLRLRKDKVPGPGSQKSNKKVYFLLLAYGLVLCTGLGSLLRYPSPGVCVGTYEGTISSACPSDTTFVFRVDVDDGEHFYIDASDVRRSNFTRYLNDPGYLCEPNCEFVQTDLKIEVCTLRDIAANEELTARYIEWNTFLGSDSEDTEDMIAPRSTRPRRAANQSASRASTSSVVPLPAPSPYCTSPQYRTVPHDRTIPPSPCRWNHRGATPTKS